MELGWFPKLESLDEALLSLPWLCMEVDDEPLELAGPGLLMFPELFCFIIANALEEAIFIVESGVFISLRSHFNS